MKVIQLSEDREDADQTPIKGIASDDYRELKNILFGRIINGKLFYSPMNLSSVVSRFAMGTRMMGT